ncbi:unnamed protein product [Nyctereutes procyonoides]|uniref:(raccoon dog) hypothetical protein n=1 Tax=Nyctereutes procyonoides TaxID=34880 RepID=A0A811Z0V1_NYCPR|nr:unnamed protein product [Nyctereutes procyonoides]
MKLGRVMLVLAGCYSGHKVVIVKNIDDGTSDCPYSHALVAGMDCSPCKVTAPMGKKKLPNCQRSRQKTMVNKAVFRDPALQHKNKWSFQKLQF